VEYADDLRKAIRLPPNRRGVSGLVRNGRTDSGDYGGKNIQDYLDATDAMARGLMLCK